ncbi:MAG: MarR family winged helix-turn-helix transcriptional regulator [Acutalibacteraceae bacterium]
MDKYEALKLENQLCFPLYACAREVVKKYKPYLDGLDLTYTQYITLMVLWEHKKITVKQIGDLLRLDSGTLTPVLKKLEEKKLITRKRSKEDERNLIVTLTQQGEEIKSRAVDIPNKLAPCLSLSVEEAQQLYTLLYKLLNNF